MRVWIAILIMLHLMLVPVFSQIQASLDKADELYNSDMFQPCKELLLRVLPEAATNPEKAEVHWRLAKVTQLLGDLAEEQGAEEQELLKYFEEGEKYADQAIALAPQNHNGYFWKSANMGRWGQVKGILNALGKAQPMLEQLKLALLRSPEHADSFYVLEQLYIQVPGWPISFGNKEYGVSLGRKAVELMQQELKNGKLKTPKYDYFTELAKSLYERNWSLAKRNNEQPKLKEKYDKAQGNFEKSLFYEGILTLSKESDREEALKLVQWVVQELNNVPEKERNRERRNDLKEAKDLLKDWSK